ncbi:hypothetical protein [Winogradskyella schleiferi]|uniref:hypothetical protein n=1 Tax=Winogradskyella schleiferi TaxID=2686078 RepID=UPI0015B80A65|nr:hypothetical protein [Winogradskyella schleiferi]
MRNQNTLNKSEILKRLEALYSDMLSLRVNDILKVRVIDNLISKVNIIIEIIKYNPRLPLYDIENAIINLCKEDNSINGVNIQILFNKKFDDVDKNKMAYLIVNV